MNLSPALDNANSWGLCPDGYFFHGLNPGDNDVTGLDGEHPLTTRGKRRKGFVLFGIAMVCNPLRLISLKFYNYFVSL